MTALEARARCAALEMLDWSDTAIASAIAELSAHFLIASPQVTPAAHEPGLWWIGAHGLEAQAASGCSCARSRRSPARGIPARG